MIDNLPSEIQPINKIVVINACYLTVCFFFSFFIFVEFISRKSGFVPFSNIKIDFNPRIDTALDVIYLNRIELQIIVVVFFLNINLKKKSSFETILWTRVKYVDQFRMEKSRFIWSMIEKN